jgi:undecaprenyl-diphosphatase
VSHVGRVINRIRREGWIVLVVLVISGGLWGFVEITDEVHEGETRHFDETVVEFLRDRENPRVAWGPSWLWKTGWNITALGSVPAL